MIERVTGELEGVVQGVGFRPFVARLAAELELAGSVHNTGRTVHVDVEGDAARVRSYMERVVRDAPPPARVERARWTPARPAGLRGFRIVHSEGEGRRGLPLPPDLGVCDACLAEVEEPGGRRHGYPFTNCTRCGPRFTIVRALPYDRERTTMAGFPMCDACEREFADPTDRRYHAQPIACPACGPHLALVDRHGAAIAHRDDALAQASEALARGAIVALKGLGGYQLACDARDDTTVAQLRERKRRPRQPFAVMVADLPGARALAHLDPVEEAALAGPARPIVLVRARPGAVAAEVAPGNRRLGVMLPTTPLHHLLLHRVGRPVVCTSGNVHDEPIATDDGDALERLGPIADLWLVHDRPIARRVDDAVVHVVDGRARTLRLGRGLGPLRIGLGEQQVGPPPVALLCVGAHLKNAPAAVSDGEAVLWPHVGDLDTPLARDAFAEAIGSLRQFLRLSPEAVVCDAHPDYASTLWSERQALPVRRVLHHHAHVAAALAEHGLAEALGVAFDGVGLGADGTAWGGELLHVSPGGCARVGHLRPFPLPGGDAAARDGDRALAGACAAAGVEPPAAAARYADLTRAPGLAPPTTSAGRLFDAVAALAGVCARSTFEGEAAIALEHAADDPNAPPYPFGVDGPVLDWAPMLRAIATAREAPARVASRFHTTLAAMIAEAAARTGPRTVVLTGGCFQNVRLAEQTLAALRERGLRALLPERVPPGDGAIALGQAWVATHAPPEAA